MLIGCALVVSIPPWFDFAFSVALTRPPSCDSFNPTLVRFCRRCCSRAWACAGHGFNPTLVRFCLCNTCLEADDLLSVSIPPWFDFATSEKSCALLVLATFQSHLGSILPGAPQLRTWRGHRFQSHLGSILPSKPQHCSMCCGAVSIPPWFDFATRYFTGRSAGRSVSIPPWFDFALTDPDERDRYFRVSIPPWFDFAELR